MKHKTVNRIGWFASIMAITMYSSYVDQIRLNLAGQKGSAVLGVFTIINCFSWLVYGFCKEKKDFPMVACNGVGFVLGIINIITICI